MVNPEIENDNLILRVEGADKIWAFKSELTIPLQHITAVRLDREITKILYHGIKFPGTAIPFIITAGTYYKSGKKLFWDIHRPEQAVVISLNHEDYDELIIEAENPISFVGELQTRIMK